MQDVEVIAVDVAVERDLPVGSDEGPLVEQLHVGEAERVECCGITAEPGVEVERGVGPEDGEDHAASFLAREFGEATSLRVEIPELLAAGDPDEGP